MKKNKFFPSVFPLSLIVLLMIASNVAAQTTECNPVRSLQVSHVTVSGAIVSWQRPDAGAYEGAHVEWLKQGESQWQWELTSDTAFALWGLDSASHYLVRVAAMCEGRLLSEHDTVWLQTHIMPCTMYDTLHATTPTIAGSTSSSLGVLPLITNRRHSLSQQLVMADEMQDSGDIHALSFFFTSSVESLRERCTIYLAHTTLDSICDTQYVPIQQMTPVYEGPIRLTPGWITLEFNLTQFHYDGLSNLVVAVADHSDTAFLGNYTFRGHTAPKKSLSWWSMNAGEVTPGDMFLTSNTGYSRNDMMFHMGECWQRADCHAPYAYVASISGDSIAIRWASGANETEWRIYSQVDSNDWEYWGIAYDNYYTYEGLERGVAYTFRIVAGCNDSLYGEVRAVTTCLPVELPYSDDFEQWAAGQGEPAAPCWLVAGSYQNSTPNAVDWASRSGSKSLYIQSNTGQSSIVVLPVVEPTIDMVQVNCWVKKRQNYSDYTLLVGAVPDSLFCHGRPQLDTIINHFTLIDSIQVTSMNWQYVELPLYNTPIYEGHLAILSPQGKQSYTLIDDLKLDFVPSCPHPEGLTLDSSTGDSLLLHWEGSTWPQGWLVTCGDQQIYTTDTMAAFGGLTIQTAYPITLRAWCNEGDTSTAVVDTFSTSCGKIATLPYTATFDDVTGTGYQGVGFAQCWSRHMNYNGYVTHPPYIGNQQSDNLGNQSPTAHSGSQYLRFYVTSDINGTPNSCQWAVLPQIDTSALPISTLKLSFYARLMQNSGGTRQLRVGVMSNPDSLETFEDVASISLQNSSDYSLHEVLFNNYSGQGNYIAIRADRTYWIYSMLVDDITLEAMPACPHVTGVTNTLAGYNYLTMSWTEMGNATSWRVEYGLEGFTEGTGIIDTVYTLPYTIGGLQSSTNYDFIVRPVCAQAGEGVRSTFATTAFYNTLPYFEDFADSSAYASWHFIQRRAGSGMSYTDPVVNRWAIGAATANGDNASLYITPDSGATYDYYADRDARCFAWTDIMLPDSGTYDIAYDFRCEDGDDYTDYYRVALVPASVDMSTLNYLSSYIYVDNGGSYSGPASSTWSSVMSNALITPDINNRRPGVYHLVFYWQNDGPKANGSSSYGGLPAAIDNIYLSKRSCYIATGLNLLYVSSDSARFSWSGSSGSIVGTQWLVECNGQTATYSSTPYVFAIGGLQPSTTYPVHITPLCGDGDTGATSTFYVTTHCDPLALPFYEDFDGLTNLTTPPSGLMPPCWSFAYLGYNNSLREPGVVYGTANAHSGDYSMRMYMNGCIILPEVQPTLDSVRLSFWHYGTNVTVGVMEGTSTFVPLQSFQCQNNTYTHNTITFESYTGTSRTIAIRNHESSNGVQNWIDDIAVEYISFCHTAENLHATAAHDGSLTVDWESDATGSWQIEYGPAAFTPGTGTMFTTISHPTAIPWNAEETSVIDIYVRPICGAGDTGDWVGPVPIAAPLCENPVEVSTGYSADSSSKYPISLNHSYSLTETLITADELSSHISPSDTGGITHLALFFRGEQPMTGKDHVDIWFQSTTLQNFSWSQWPVDTLTAHHVYSGSLNCTPGWNYFALSEPWFWDQSSNLMVVFVDNSGQADTSGGNFGVAIHNDKLTVGAFANNTGFDISNPARYDVLPEPTRYRPMMKLIGCNPVCEMPYNVIITDTMPTTALLTWDGTTGSYQIEVTSIEEEPSYTFDTIFTTTESNSTLLISGLQPEQQYSYSLRQLCGEDFYSDWIGGLFETTSTPCEAPTQLTAEATSWEGATLAWNTHNNHQQWQLHVWNTVMDTTLHTNESSVNIGSLEHTTTYHAAVRSICDQWGALSEWSDTIEFSTRECPVPDGLHVIFADANMVSVEWNATSGLYDLEYGTPNFPQGSGTLVVSVNTNSYEITSLESNSNYDLYVRSRCGTGLSPWSEVLHFTTQAAAIRAATETLLVTLSPNPAGSSSVLSISGIHEQLQIVLTDVSGRIVHDSTLECNGSVSRSIELGTLPSGAYFVMIKGAGIKKVLRLIVEH